jgi:hypothetical protein
MLISHPLEQTVHDLSASSDPEEATNGDDSVSDDESHGSSLEAGLDQNLHEGADNAIEGTSTGQSQQNRSIEGWLHRFCISA